MVAKKIDVLIVGGGLIGATLLLALRNLGFNVYLVDEKPIALNSDSRSLALSPASMRILEMLRIWNLLSPYLCEIQTIHVSAQACFGKVKLDGKNKALGYVIEMQYINSALNKFIENDYFWAPAKLIDLDPDSNLAKLSVNNEIINIKAKLIVAADGSYSSVRQLCNLPILQKEFKQDAIVTNIELQRQHNNIAYERFTRDGPLALLPLINNRVSLIWGMENNKAKYYLNCLESEFLKKLYKVFGYRLGRFEKIGTRKSFPLKQITMPTQVYKSIVFIGNAAHTLHPIAGQGFNLGLRDVAMLTQCIAQHGLDNSMLEHYRQSRKVDQKRITQLTNILVEFFGSKLPGFNFIKSLGLLTFANISLLQNQLSKYSSGFGGEVSDLVCGIPLKRIFYEPNL